MFLLKNLKLDFTKKKANLVHFLIVKSAKNGDKVRGIQHYLDPKKCVLGHSKSDSCFSIKSTFPFT